MKKIVTLLLAAAALGTFSCKSAPSQAEVDTAFQNVYDTYAESLILDGAETYTVRSGDTLTAITKEQYGTDNGYYFPLIMLASKDVILDPDLIRPGMELTVPNFEANVNDASLRPKLKSYFKDIAEVYKKKNTDRASETRDALLKLADTF